MTTLPPANSGRKAKAVARNRARHVRSAQELIITVGPQATIDDFAEHAEVAVATLYKHFGSKEGMVLAAVEDALQRWEQWMMQVVAPISDPLEELVASLRVMLRTRDTRPMEGAIMARAGQANMAPLDHLGAGFQQAVARLVQQGLLPADHIEARARALLAVVADEGIRQMNTPTATPEEADTVLEWALPMLGISPAKAKRLAHAPLPPLEVPAG
ncbi:MAG: TetR/AcrR family transcriptional regulator [Thermoleophilia bacterium]